MVRCTVALGVSGAEAGVAAQALSAKAKAAAKARIMISPEVYCLVALALGAMARGINPVLFGGASQLDCQRKHSERQHEVERAAQRPELEKVETHIAITSKRYASFACAGN
jgi:hypothetical protein